MAQYNALQSKDEGCLYFITDKNVIYRGTVNVTSRYLIGSIPAASNPDGLPGIRLTDQVTGHYYDIPLLESVSGFLENNLVLHFHENTVGSDSDLLSAINAEIGSPGTGIAPAGTVFRVETNSSVRLSFNPGQFPKADYLIAKNHDLIIALYNVGDAKVDIDGVKVSWENNHQAFAVIPTDLVDLVTAPNGLTENAVVLGNGAKTIKVLPFAGASKVLRTNASNDGVEWVTPETVENVVYWEDIDAE